MKSYNVLFAEDVPHYGSAVIEAPDDAAAIEIAKAYDRDNLIQLDAEWSDSVCIRIVDITDDETAQVIADSIPLDHCFLRYGGEPDRLLCDAAPDLLRGLDAATQILKRIAEALHYDDGHSVTFLEAREIQDLYADAIGKTDELDAILKRARGQK